MGMLVRRAVIVLVPIAWTWYRSRRKAQREEGRRETPGAPPA